MNYLLFRYLCSFSDIRENCWWNASVFMQIETWVRLTQWDMYSVTIACCVGLFFLSQNWIDFFSPEFPCLCSVRQIDGYRKDVCCLLWSTWYSKLDIGRFLWSFYVLLKYFFITLEKMLYFLIWLLNFSRFIFWTSYTNLSNEAYAAYLKYLQNYLCIWGGTTHSVWGWVSLPSLSNAPWKTAHSFS